MEKIMKHIVIVVLLAIPMICECVTVAYSPSVGGQPLIFHTNTTFDPSKYSAATWSQIENALLIRSTYSQHLENLSYKNCCARWNFWVNSFGQWFSQHGQNQVGYNDFTGGFTIGADTCFNDFLIGAAFSYTNSNLHWKDSAGHGDINSYYGGLYSSWNNECFYVNAAVLGAYNDYDTSRHVLFRSIDFHAHASHNGWEALAEIEAGVEFQELFCNVDLVPYISVDYVYLSQQGYNEHGAERFDLHVENRNDQLIQSELGLQFLRRMNCECCCRSWMLIPNLSLSYINQTPLTARSYRFNYVTRTPLGSVSGWDFERNLGAVTLNFNVLDCTETWNFTLHYNGQFGKNYSCQTGSIMCNISI